MPTSSSGRKTSGCAGCAGVFAIIFCGGFLYILGHPADDGRQRPPAESPPRVDAPQPAAEGPAPSGPTLPAELPPAAPALCKAPMLAAKTAREVDAVLGTAASVDIEADHANRRYAKWKPLGVDLNVQFFGGYAGIVCANWGDGDIRMNTSTEALAMLGIREDSLTKTIDETLDNGWKNVMWIGTVDGVQVAVQAHSEGPSKWYFVVVSFPDVLNGKASTARKASLAGDNTATASPKFIAHFKGSKPKPIAKYVEDGDAYIITGLTGGRGRYPKSMIDHFESLDRDGEQPVVRRWSDKSGNFSVDAELVETDGETVRLKRADGKIVSVPLDKLSAEDQRYAEQEAGQSKRSTPAK